MRIAIVDDDRDEHVLLTEIGELNAHGRSVDAFLRFNDFLKAGPQHYDHVFLDRCLPPARDYADNLEQLEAAGFQGHVILITASKRPTVLRRYGFNVSGPFDKLDLLDPEALQASLSPL